jgi:hypothetical protein
MSILQFATERALVASTAEVGARALALNSGREFYRNSYGWAPSQGGTLLTKSNRFAASTRNTIALTGSSSSDRCTRDIGDGFETLTSDGYIFGAHLACGQNLRLVKNYGLSGGTIATIAPTLDTALSEFPSLDFVVLQWFANDIGSVGAAAAEVYIRDALRKCRAHGARPIVTINHPQNTFDSADFAELEGYKQRMHALEEAFPGELFVVDHWAEVAEPGGYCRPGMLMDALHLSQQGAEAVGRAWKTFAQRAFIQNHDGWRLDQIGDPITNNWDFRNGQSGISWTSSSASLDRIYEDSVGRHGLIVPDNSSSDAFLISRVDSAPVAGQTYVVAAELEVVTPCKKLSVYVRNNASTRRLATGYTDYLGSTTAAGEYKTGERHILASPVFDPGTVFAASNIVIGAAIAGGTVKVRQLGVVRVG